MARYLVQGAESLIDTYRPSQDRAADFDAARILSSNADDVACGPKEKRNNGTMGRPLSGRWLINAYRFPRSTFGVSKTYRCIN